MIAQLKVVLDGIEPPIWRRIEVPLDLTFARLHDVLQITFGWTDSHLHQFEAGELRIGVPDPDWGDENVEDEQVVRLDRVIPRSKRFIYEYDFGDSWIHRITVEKTQEPEEGAAYPRCVGGERSAPPEDCGGAPGYEEFLDAISDRDHEEHESMLEWSGGKFDPERFDLASVNRRLSSLTKRSRRRRS
jgi:hypothetical protein